MTDENAKRLNLMRFWLFGTFVIVFAAVTIYIGMFTNKDWMMALRAGFPIWGIVAVLCVIWYFGYKYWSGKKTPKGGPGSPTQTPS